MAGRLAYAAVCGAALLAGMVMQGDIDFNGRDDQRVDERRIDRAVSRSVDRSVDRDVDRDVERSVSRAQVQQREAEMRRALSAAVAELARAEGSLITLRIDEDIPAEIIRQAEERRDAARATVEQLADTARAGSRDERGAMREQIRDSVRDAVRS